MTPTAQEAIYNPLGLIPDAATPQHLIAVNKNTLHKPSRKQKIIESLVHRFEHGKFDIYFPNGYVISHKGSKKGPHGILVVKNEACFTRFLKAGILGICESYIHDEWDTPNMAALYTLCLINEKAIEKELMGKPVVRFISKIYHLLRPNTRKGSKKNISKHYDLGNNFYKLWLDPSMTYSSALFTSAKQSLEEAQITKYKRLADQLKIKKGDRLLEVGCGWGGFAEYVATHYDVNVVCLTISEEQLRYAQKRMKDKKLDKKVEIRFQDYRDIHEKFDAIVSIEMFEAVGEEYWDTYFTTLKKCLNKNGTIALQIITIADHYFEQYRTTADYIQRYIFPGGMLPSTAILNKIITKNGFRLTQEKDFGFDYAKTLMIWNKNFQKNWSKIEKLGFDRKFKRTWEQYLAYCTAGFLTKNIDVVQLTLKSK